MIGSVTLANMRLSIVDGNAFVDFSSDVFGDHIGDKLIVYDSAGKTATGYIHHNASDDPFVQMTYAASGSSGIAVADNDNLDFGTGNFTLVWKGALPDWTPSTLVRLMWKYQSNALRYDLFINTDGKVSLRLNGTEWKSSTTTGLTDGVEAEIAATVTVVETNTLVDFYVNGIVLGTQISHANVGTVSNDGTLYILGLDTVRYAGINKSALTFNRALTAAEVLSLYENGIAEADKWGNQTGPVSGCVLALEPEGINTTNWQDSSTNNLDASYPATGYSVYPDGTGVRITSTPGGTTYNWASVESGFNYNDSSGYTYSIVASRDILYEDNDILVMDIKDAPTTDGTSTIIYASDFNCKKLSIENIRHSIYGVKLVLSFDATIDDKCLIITGNDTIDIGNPILNPMSAGYTGDIVLTTLGVTEDSTYNLIIKLRKY